jgi:hypothetical protein
VSRIYVASSWRNKVISGVIAELRLAQYSVYDFRETDERGSGFNWADIDPGWKSWDARTFRRYLFHPLASTGFTRDMHEIYRCDALVLVLPCGRSAHLELGLAIGLHKPVAVLLDDGEPELMYRAVDRLCVSTAEILDFLERSVR